MGFAELTQYVGFPLRYLYLGGGGFAPGLLSGL